MDAGREHLALLRITRRKIVLLPFPGRETSPHLYCGAHHHPCAVSNALRDEAGIQAVKILTYILCSAFCTVAIEA